MRLDLVSRFAARPLEIVSWGLPLTYAYDALAHAIRGTFDARFALDVCVTVGATLLALLLGALTLRRRTP